MSDWHSWFDQKKMDIITRLRCAIPANAAFKELFEEAATSIETMRTIRADAEGRWAAANNELHATEKKLHNLIVLNDSLRQEIRLQRQEMASLREERKIFLQMDAGLRIPQIAVSGDIP